MANEKIKQIDIIAIMKAIGQHRKVFFIVLPATFVLACLFIICIPRYYTSTAKLAPELSTFNASSLSDIASSFGIDLSSASSNEDAIVPELYPDLIASNDFLTSLFNVKVKTIDGKIQTTYYDYLATKLERPWWNGAVEAVKKIFEEKDTFHLDESKVNPFRLTRKQDKVARRMADNIVCKVDKKNYVISITVEDQDPLISAAITDTVKSRLQQFITQYRTQKARNDLKYYQRLSSEAKAKYEKTRRIYGSYSDANQDIVLESYRLKQNDLENEMQLQYNNYTAMQTQVQQAQARLTLQTPAFTTLQSASVPLKPAGPKRMLFVLGMCVLAFIITTVCTTRKVIFGEE